MPVNPTETRTFLLTDVQGSTPLWEQFPAAMSQALARHDALIEGLAQAHNGSPIRPRGEGDSRFIVFQRAIDGVRAAAAIQRALQAEPWPGGIPFSVRIALNTGEGEYRDGDYYGTAVNRCARLRGLAHGGQILISQSTYGLVVDTLPEGFDLLDLGEHPLRGLRRSEHVYQVGAPGLPVRFRPLVTVTQKEPLPISEVSRQQPAFLAAESIGKTPEPPVFVAREVEMAWLNAALESALSGEGRVVFIGGGPGRGKTTLADAFTCQAVRDNPNLLIARGVCHAYSGVGDPYGPFREVLGMLTGDLEPQWVAGLISTQAARRSWDAVPVAIEVILNHGPHLPGIFVEPKALTSRAVSALPPESPALQELLSALSHRPEHPVDLDQGYLFEQYTNVLLALAVDQPLLLVLDDMQWTDTSSAGLLFHLGRRLAGARILVVCTYRPEEVALGRASFRVHPEASERHPLEKVLTEFKRKFGEVVLDLGDMAGGAGRIFVDAYLDSEPNHLGEEFRRALFHHTAGHPLFTVELLRAMKSRGDIFQEDGVWVPGPSLDWDTLPARVEGVLDERLDRLDEGLHELLRVASVEGVRFTSQVLARVQGIDELQLLRQLKHELEDRHRLVVELEDVRVGDHWLGHYRFSHVLFQQRLYSRLSEGERRLLHRAIGVILEDYYEGRETEIAVQLALHFAGDPLKERCYAALAGEQAARQFANNEALAYFTRALALTPAEDAAGRYRLLLSREAVHNLLGEREAQKEDLEAIKVLAADLAGSEADPGQAEAAARWAKYTSHTDYQGAGTLAENAVVLAVSEGRLDVAVKAYLTWAKSLRIQGEHLAAVQQAEAGIALAQEIGDLRGESALVNMLGLITLDRGDPGAASGHFEHGLSIAHEIGDRQIEAQPLNNLGNIAAHVGDYTASQRYYEQALRLAREIGNRRGEAVVNGNLGWLAGVQGDFRAAEHRYEQQRVIAREIGDRYQEAYVAINLCTALLAHGNPDGALVYAQEGLETTRETGDRSGEAWALTNLGHVYVELEEMDAAETHYQQALAVRRSLEQPNLAAEPLAGLARISFKRGKLPAAQGRVVEILAYLDGGGGLDGAEEPLRVLLTCYRVLEAVGDMRAEAVLTDAHNLLMERANRIRDEGLRAKFLENIPANREVMVAWKNRKS